MFGNLGVHVILNPAGTFSFVGTLPAVLGSVVPATTADVMAGRAEMGPDGNIWTLKFPVFATAAEAVSFAAERGVTAKVSRGGA